MFLANGAAYGAWAASVASIKEGLGASDGALGLALLCIATGAIAAMPLAGWFGARRVPHLLPAATLASAVLLPTPALVGSVPMLGLSLLLTGAAAGSLDVLMNARASRIEQTAGVAIMSSFHAAFSLGGLLGTVLVMACRALDLGALGGLLATSVLLAAAAAVHRVLDPVPDLAAPDSPRIVRPSRAVLLIGVLAGLAFLTEGAVADWSGVFARTVAGLGEVAAASGYAAFSAGMVLMRLAGDGLVQRAGPVWTLRAGGLIAGAGMALPVLWPAAAPGGFFLVGLGAANAAPILFSAAGRVGPTALAAVASLGYGGMLFGPPLIGGIAELSGLRLALLIPAASMVLIAASARLGRA